MTSQSRYKSYGSYHPYVKTLFPISSKNAVQKLESEIKNIFHAKHCIALPMARVGIYLAIKNLIRPGQLVILSPYTISDVVNMVCCAGGKPCFIDIDASTTNIDPELVEKKIESVAEGQIGAILVTHLHGIAAPIEKICEIAKRKKIPVIEDAAQAMGGIVNGVRLGNHADVGIFSLGLYKNINCFYGGLLVCKDDKLATTIRNQVDTFANFEFSRVFKKLIFSLFVDFLSSRVVFNFFMFPLIRYGFLNDKPSINKLTSIELEVRNDLEVPENYLRKLRGFQALIAVKQLSTIDDHSKARIGHAKHYHDELRKIPGLTIPPEPFKLENIYTYYPISLKNREELLKWLMFHGQDVAPQHLKDCSQLPPYKKYKSDCPIASTTAAQVVLLPTYPSYSKQNIKKNCEIIKWYFAAGQPKFQTSSQLPVHYQKEQRIAGDPFPEVAHAEHGPARDSEQSPTL